MRKKIALALLFLTFFVSHSQELVWNTDMSTAVNKSIELKKPLFLFFTGSDWCGWCIRLQKEVLKTPEFIAWAKQNVILVELDYPRTLPQSDEIKAQNNQMQQIFGIRGFPTVQLVWAKAEGEKINFSQIGTLGYMAGGPKIWIEQVDNFLKKS